MLVSQPNHSTHKIEAAGVGAAGDIDRGHGIEEPAFLFHLIEGRRFGYIGVQIDASKVAHGSFFAASRANAC